MKKTARPLPVSVFVITQDEADNLPRLLDSVADFAEVVIVDSGSADGTVELAKASGATVIHQPWLGYAGQKQFALEQCTQPWVLNLDADEVVTKSMLGVIKETVNRPEIGAVRFKRNDIFIGEMPSKWVKKPNNLRFYQRQLACFNTEQKVHESAKVKGKEIFVSASFDHHGYDDIGSLISKMNHYSTLRATEKFESGKRGSFIKLLLILPVEFIRQMLLQRYVFFGRRGLILSAINAFYAFLKEAKLLELNLRANAK